jgi:FkbM family methyltransferase
MLQDLRRKARDEGMALYPLKTRAPYLKGYGFRPDTVFDVGVADGTPWLYNSFPEVRFVLVDPLPGSQEAVEAQGVLNDNVDFHAVALGARAGQAVLSVPHSVKGREGAMASLLPRSDRLRNRIAFADEVSVPLTTLDTLAAAYSGRLGLKIDTEGYELEVLKGGRETLARCDFVILELSVTPRFDGVGLPSAVIGLLAETGLELRDVLRTGAGAGKKARPRYFDALFTRWPS